MTPTYLRSPDNSDETIIVACLAGLATSYVMDRTSRREIMASTAENLRRVLWSLADHVGGEKSPKALTRVRIERWLGSGDVSAATVRARLSMTRGWCRWMALHGHLRGDPTVGITSPRQPRYVPRALKAEQVSALLEACSDPRDVLVATLMVQEGLRCCEVARLQLGDLDFDGRLVLVRGKGGHERVLPLSEQTWAALGGYLSRDPAVAGPLIRSYQRPHRGISPAYISDRVRWRMADAHVPASAHALRHTAATDMLRSGAHLRDVQAALGHKLLSTTQVYLPWLVGDLRRAMGGRTYGHWSLDQAVVASA